MQRIDAEPFQLINVVLVIFGAESLLISGCADILTPTLTAPTSRPVLIVQKKNAKALAPASPVSRHARGAPAPNPPPTVPRPADLVFFDGFEYTAGRDDANAVSIFQQQGGWSWAKTQQSSSGASGYLYTVDRIPGYTGAFPGGSSSRALAMEARPASLNSQTDFYLQYGEGDLAAYDNAIPGNVWFQFWVYINNYGDQLSRMTTRNKLLYPCNGPYPCQLQTWLVYQGGDSLLPSRESLGNPSSGGAFLQNWLNTNNSDYAALPAPSWEAHRLGQTNTAEYMVANRWTLVKIHFDTSTASGVYEAWMRPQGGNWVKVADWVDGVTSGFTWRVHPGNIGGHRVLRMPTTVPGGSNDALYDSWMYIDDFAIARSEAGLPVYQ